MSEFKVIETQEQFDEAIKERLTREREKVEKEYLSPEDVKKKYDGYLSADAVQEKYKEYLSPEQVREKDNLIKGYERNASRVKIAMSEGIPYELAEKISGETEEEMKKDAKTLSGFLKKNNPYPDYEPEPSGNKDSKKEAMRKMLNNLKGEQ